MRIISKSRNHFYGTHKGCTVEIDRERHQGLRDAGRRFYITVTHAGGGYLYDGWTEDHVVTMADAKREALYGAGLKKRPIPTGDQSHGG